MNDADDAADAVHDLAVELLNDGFEDYHDEALRAAARDLGIEDVDAAVEAVDARADLTLSSDLGEQIREGERALAAFLGDGGEGSA